MKGIDVSSNQHPANKPIDWFAVADAGYGFAIVKATQGVSYVNPWLAYDLDDARAAGLFVGAYHYWEPDQDAIVQAKNFTSSLIGQVLDLGVWLDWEPPEMAPYSAQPLIGAFIAEAKEARPGIGMYCDLSWRDQLKGENALPGRLWLAAWGPEQPSGCILWQNATGVPVAGVPELVDTDIIVKSRSLNLPSSPPPRPSAATAVSMVPHEDSQESDGVSDEPAKSDEEQTQTPVSEQSLMEHPTEP
jgi:lysozyme